MHYANTLKTAVACAFLGLGTLTVQVSGAHAQPQFDKKLAKALADKAAETLGGLRLGASDDDRAAPAATATVFGRVKTDVIETGSIRSYGRRSIKPETENSAATTRWLLPRTDIRVVYSG